MAEQLPNMEGLVIAGAVYVKEADCRASVNAALARTAAERAALREALEAFMNVHDTQSVDAAREQASAALALGQGQEKGE